MDEWKSLMCECVLPCRYVYQQGQRWEYFISCPCALNYYVFACVYFSVVIMYPCEQPSITFLFFPHMCMCVWQHCFANLFTVHQGQGAELRWDFWWQFPYCPGSCGHGAHSWCCGCPLRHGEIKADSRCHKGVCLVLFNSPKLWRSAKPIPHYGKHSITGIIILLSKTRRERRKLNSGRKHFYFSHTWTHTWRL